MEYNYDLNRKVCTNCGNGGEEQTEKIGIPFTKKQLGQGLWFGLLLGTFIWGIIDWNGVGTGVFIMVWCLGQLGFALYISCSYNTTLSYYEVMPWYLPFYWLVRLFSGGGYESQTGRIAEKFKWKEVKEK